MGDNTIILIVALIGAVSGILAFIISLLKVKKQNKKMGADITAQITNAASTMLNHMKEQIASLEDDIECESNRNK